MLCDLACKYLNGVYEFEGFHEGAPKYQTEIWVTDIHVYKAKVDKFPFWFISMDKPGNKRKLITGIIVLRTLAHCLLRVGETDLGKVQNRP